MRQNMEELSATNEQVERLKQEEDRKQKEMIKNIEDNKDMLMRVIDNIPGKIFVKDNESRIILLNKAVANAYNLPKEKLINTTDFEFFSTEDATEYRKIEKEIMDTGKIEHIPEEIFKDKEGNVRILDTIKMPFKISGDDRVGLLGVQTDVTDIKTMERQLQEQKTVMQKEIDELKAEIERLQSK